MNYPGTVEISELRGVFAGFAETSVEHVQEAQNGHQDRVKTTVRLRGRIASTKAHGL